MADISKVDAGKFATFITDVKAELKASHADRNTDGAFLTADDLTTFIADLNADGTKWNDTGLFSLDDVKSIAGTLNSNFTVIDQYGASQTQGGVDGKISSDEMFNFEKDEKKARADLAYTTGGGTKVSGPTGGDDAYTKLNAILDKTPALKDGRSDLKIYDDKTATWTANGTSFFMAADGKKIYGTKDGVKTTYTLDETTGATAGQFLTDAQLSQQQQDALNAKAKKRQDNGAEVTSGDSAPQDDASVLNKANSNISDAASGTSFLTSLGLKDGSTQDEVRKAEVDALNAWVGDKSDANKVKWQRLHRIGLDFKTISAQVVDGAQGDGSTVDGKRLNAYVAQLDGTASKTGTSENTKGTVVANGQVVGSGPNKDTTGVGTGGPDNKNPGPGTTEGPAPAAAPGNNNSGATPPEQANALTGYIKQTSDAQDLLNKIDALAGETGVAATDGLVTPDDLSKAEAKALSNFQGATTDADKNEAALRWNQIRRIRENYTAWAGASADTLSTAELLQGAAGTLPQNPGEPTQDDKAITNVGMTEASQAVGFLKDLGLKPSSTHEDVIKARAAALAAYKDAVANNSTPNEAGKQWNKFRILDEKFSTYAPDGNLTAASVATALNLPGTLPAGDVTIEGGVDGNPPDDNHSLTELVGNTGTSVFNDIIFPNSETAEHRNSGDNVGITAVGLDQAIAKMKAGYNQAGISDTDKAAFAKNWNILTKMKTQFYDIDIEDTKEDKVITLPNLNAHIRASGPRIRLGTKDDHPDITKFSSWFLTDSSGNPKPPGEAVTEDGAVEFMIPGSDAASSDIVYQATEVPLTTGPGGQTVYQTIDDQHIQFYIDDTGKLVQTDETRAKVQRGQDVTPPSGYTISDSGTLNTNLKSLFLQLALDHGEKGEAAGSTNNGSYKLSEEDLNLIANYAPSVANSYGKFQVTMDNIYKLPGGQKQIWDIKQAAMNIKGAAGSDDSKIRDLEKKLATFRNAGFVPAGRAGSMPIPNPSFGLADDGTIGLAELQNIMKLKAGFTPEQVAFAKNLLDNFNKYASTPGQDTKGSKWIDGFSVAQNDLGFV